MQDKNQNLLYFAYGEHMNEEEMKKLCPQARKVGMSALEGYTLCFFGRDGMGRAGLEAAPGRHVPGLRLGAAGGAGGAARPGGGLPLFCPPRDSHVFHRRHGAARAGLHHRARPAAGKAGVCGVRYHAGGLCRGRLDVAILQEAAARSAP